jgi:ribose 5-phosphate isomerase B
MKIYIGADYKGFEFKESIIGFLKDAGHEVIDEGAHSYQEGDDFNDPAIKVASEVREDIGSIGILICESAHGVTIQANRFRGIRAAHCDSVESAQMAREHDDANILCLSAHFTGEDEAREIINAFLDTDFKNLERRIRRINRLDEREDYD